MTRISLNSSFRSLTRLGMTFAFRHAYFPGVVIAILNIDSENQYDRNYYQNNIKQFVNYALSANADLDLTSTFSSSRRIAKRGTVCRVSASTFPSNGTLKHIQF